MGAPAIDTIDRLIMKGFLPVEVRDRHLWDEAWCKGECRTRMVVLKMPADGEHEGLAGAVMHLGALAFSRLACLNCGWSWLTNTRVKGGKGAWDDVNDPSLKKAFSPPRL